VVGVLLVNWAALTGFITGLTALAGSVGGVIALLKHVKNVASATPVASSDIPTSANVPEVLPAVARMEVEPMTVATRPGYDATGDNLAHVPADGLIKALYVTGSGGVPASSAQLAKNPGCLRIDQSPVNTAMDETADVLDYENGAAGAGQVAPWAKNALANWHSGKRPGQRMPAIYMSRSNVTAVVNALIAGGVKSGVGLWVADWNLNPTQAAAEVSAGTGPFPVIGRQYSNKGGGGLYDLDVFSTPWTDNVSKAPSPTPAPVATIHGMLSTGGPETFASRAVSSTDDGVTWR
jgi:hypothetical protein